MLVQDFLHHSADRLPDKVALVCQGRRLTYLEIEAMANRLANAMLEHGLERGDRVAIHLPNSIEAVIGIFATLKAGGVFVVVNPTVGQNKLSYILNNCQAAVLLVDARKADVVDTVMSAIPSLKFGLFCAKNAVAAVAERERCLDFETVQTAYPAHRPPQTNIDVDLACLIYTSGTSGSPKGVMCDHSNVVFAAGSIIEYLQNVEDDIIFSVLPLSFDYGLYQLLMAFKFGGRLILERSFAYPAAILKRVAAEKVTGFPGVPTTFAILLRMDLGLYDLSSLRYLTNTGAALHPNHIAKIRQNFPGVTLYSMYGLTETKRTLYLPPDQLDQRPDSVGVAIPGTEVWLEDEAGNRLGPGQVGELVIRGRHVMRGYWGDPEATAGRFRPGPLPGERVCYSDDLFRMDEEGYMYFVSRKDDIIKSRAEKVAPKEVENVLYQLPGVVEVAVIGVPDLILDQAIKVFIVADTPELSKTRVLAHCRTHLEDYMMPKYVEFRDILPKNPSGKIAKIELT